MTFGVEPSRPSLRRKQSANGRSSQIVRGKSRVISTATGRRGGTVKKNKDKFEDLIQLVKEQRSSKKERIVVSSEV